MAKVTYSAQAAAPALNNEQIAQYLAMQGQIGGSPGAQYDPLGEQLETMKPHPVYNALQGAADAGGQIAAAYLRKQQYQKLAQAQTANNQALAGAYQTATNTDQNIDPQSGALMSKGDFQPMPQQAPQPDGPQQPPMAPDQSGAPMQEPQPANVSWAQGALNQMQPLSPNERAAEAYSQIASKNPVLANQNLAEIYKASAMAQPAPIQQEKGAPGDQFFARDPITGQMSSTPSASVPVLPPDILKPGVLSAEEARTAAGKTKWRAATPDENTANGYPPTMKGAQVSDEGEFKPPVKQPGAIGPAYNSFDGTPLGGAVDYTDPGIAAKIQSGDIITHEPRPLPTADAQTLTKAGNQVQELEQQVAKFKPEYSRIVGADSQLRGFLGGKAFNEGADWINQTKSILLQNTRDITGRSPQLIAEYNLIRPEATDAPDVIMAKMNNLIQLKKQEAGNLANSYLKGGYLGQQVVQSLGFDPRQGASNAPAAAPAAPAPGAYTWTPNGGLAPK